MALRGDSYMFEEEAARKLCLRKPWSHGLDAKRSSNPKRYSLGARTLESEK